MPTQHSINSFVKGMNKDLDVSVLQKDMYLDAKNFRVVTTEGSTTTALEVVDGNIIQANVSIAGGYSIIGYATVRNKLVLFTTNNTNSIIYVMDVIDGVYTNFATLYNDNSSPDGSTFNFSTSHQIKALGRYETEDIQKVYWTDNYNNLRFINIADPDVQTYSTTRFEIIPPITESSITIDSVGTGSLKAGKVQYAYQLYNLNGAESAFVRMSDFIALSNTTISGNDVQFTGTKAGEPSGKSVTFSIASLDTRFSRIRVVRIMYVDINELPVINIIEEATLSSSMTFVDNGVKNLGELTVEEFGFINYDFKCGDIETKNNILFTSNITENIWDIDYDARAFCFSYVTTGGTITSATATLFTESSTSGDYDLYTAAQLAIDKALPTPTCSIAETHDAICSQNNLSFDGTRVLSPGAGLVHLYDYIFQSNGITLGGEGVNVKYVFDRSDSYVLSDTMSSIPTESHYDTETNNEFSFTHIHDEIYAYAIQLKNSKGQFSYPKWIGDIRTPFTNSTYPFAIGTTNTLNAKPLKIVFTVDNLPTDCVGYRIVRCERKAQDRTVLAQGVISASRIFLGTTTFRCAAPQITTIRHMDGSNPVISSSLSPFRVDLNLDRTLLQFYSPEISFGNKINFSSGDRLDYIAYISFGYNYYRDNADSGLSFINNLNYYPLTPNTFISVKIGGTKIDHETSTNNVVPYSSNISKLVEDCQVIDPDPSSGTNDISPRAITIGALQFENYARPYGSENLQGKSGKCLVIKLPSSFNFATGIDTTNTYGNKLALCNYRRNIVPYGGNTYTSRFSREYIPVTDVIPDTTATVIVEGDSFVSYFELQRLMTVLDGETTVNPEENSLEIIKFPVETSIATRWRNSKTFCQLCPGNVLVSTNSINIQETSGTHVNASLKFDQEYGLYDYSSVYSRQNNLFKVIPKPFDITDNKTYDTRVLASDQKFNGEETDSWTKFRVNNFIDVDSSYGSINNLLSYNNELYFWQDKGFGHLSVNQRSLLQDNNPGSLVVGTGGILDRYDYISTTAGNISPFGLVRSNNGVYWLDTLNSTICRFSGQLEPLSKVKGLQSYLNSKVTKTTTAIGGYDIKYNEVFFTLYGDTQSIIYSEIMDGFGPFQSFTPTRYFQAFDGTISTTSNNTTTYLHNEGVKSTFYGTLYPSTIKYIVNDNYDYTKVFDSIEYKTKSYNSSVLLYTDTFNTLSIYNDKQYTGVVSIVTNNASPTWNTTKREGNFSTVVPRNIVDVNITSDVDIFNAANHDTSRLFKERIRDKYAVIELTYNNTNGYRLSIPYIKTNYRISYR